MTEGSGAWLALFISGLCVIGNGFFVAAEFALAKVRPSSLEAMAKGGDGGAARALKMTQSLDQYLSATQLGITLVSLGLGWLGEPALAHLMSPTLRDLGFSPTAVHATAIAVGFSILSLFHIVVGELVPKSLALLRPEQISIFSARPLQFFFVLTWPVLKILNWLSTLVLKMLRLPAPDHAEGVLSLEEIRLIMQAHFRGEDPGDRKRDLIERVLRGTDRPVRTVMVPRVDTVTLSTNFDLKECLDVVRKHGYSRYPLCDDGDPDKVVGYIYVKDLLTTTALPKEGISSLKRDPLFVPASRTVGDLLSEMQITSTPIAIVVDEYGGTSGIVTLEDVVEEIVGEIQDEHDQEAPRILTRGDGTVEVDGALPWGELALDGLELQELEGADTVGGFAVVALGRLAKRGDRVRVGRWDMVVRDVRGRRVRRVLFVRRPESIPSDAISAEATSLADTETRAGNDE